MFDFMFSQKFEDRIWRNSAKWLAKAFAAAEKAKVAGDYHTANVVWAVLWYLWTMSLDIPRDSLRLEIEVDDPAQTESGHYDLAVLYFGDKRLSIPLPFLGIAAKHERKGNVTGSLWRSHCYAHDDVTFKTAPRTTRLKGGHRLSGRVQLCPHLLDELGIGHALAETAIDSALNRQLFELDKIKRRWPEEKPTTEPVAS